MQVASSKAEVGGRKETEDINDSKGAVVKDGVPKNKQFCNHNT